MSPSPSLRIRRLVVDGSLMLDIHFEDGVSVITTPGNDPRHSNKAGKTGLVELIQYGLGRQVRNRAEFHFAPIQASVETLWLEIVCNGRTLTIRRSLQQHNAGVGVFLRPFDAEMRDPPNETMDLSDLSGYLLSQLGIPLVQVTQRDGRLIPLSFPTLMRAFVLHQDDSFSAVLDKVEPDSRRGDILALLSAVRLQPVYDLEVKKGNAITRANRLEQSYNAVREFLAKQGVQSLEGARGLARDAHQAAAMAVAARQAEQVRLRDSGSRPQDGRQEVVGRTDAIRQQLLAVRERRVVSERDLLGYREESTRLLQLAASLEVDAAKARRLHVSQSVLSSFDFDVCPRCTQEVTPDMRARELRRRCSLCSRPLMMTSDSVPRTAPAAADIAQQLDEARQMLAEAQADAADVERELADLRRAERGFAETLDAETAAFMSPAFDALLALNQLVVEREAAAADAARLLRQAEGLGELFNDMTTAMRAAAEADTALRSAQAEATRRLSDLESIYHGVLRDIDFPDVDRVEIDPYTLMPTLDGQLYVHRGAALRGLAVVAYHLALLRLSLDHRTLFPRLLVIDSPAVGDLNPKSHDRLLRYIAEIHQGAWSQDGKTSPPWQIILTTRRMVPELQPYVVRRIKATPGQMLLRPRRDEPDSLVF